MNGLSNVECFLEGRIAVLEQAVKRLLVHCPNPELVMDELRTLLHDEPNVVYMVKFPEPMIKGMEHTIKVLSNYRDGL